jgi:hypothetical protein
MSNVSAAWRDKRKEVIARTGGSCANCGRDDIGLHVHHRYYESGKKDWDYPSETLEPLCSRCHGLADEVRRKIVRATGHLHEALAMRAIGYMQALAAVDDFPERRAAIKVLSAEFATGVGDVFGLSEDDIFALAPKGIVLVTDLMARSRYGHHRSSIDRGAIV